MKLELVEMFGKCPTRHPMCVGENTLFRILRNAETKQPISKGKWYCCIGYGFHLPETLAEALEMREEWIRATPELREKENIRKEKRLARVTS